MEEVKDEGFSTQQGPAIGAAQPALGGLAHKYEITAKDAAELDIRFVYHSPKNDQPQRYVQLRGEAKLLAQTILRNCPESRERSLALTNLEEAIFWANAAIARRE